MTDHRPDRVYASLPSIHCKGLCVAACGVIPLCAAEENRIKERHGIELSYDPSTLACSALKAGRCTIYADRPLVCRLFGLVKRMRCPHGCVPTAWVSDWKAHKLLRRLRAIAGPGALETELFKVLS